MKHITTSLLTLFISLSFCSCSVIHSFLGLDDCDYPDCKNRKVENCEYCIVHCSSYNIPDDFDNKVKKSLDNQIDYYRYNQQKDK